MNLDAAYSESLVTTTAKPSASAPVSDEVKEANRKIDAEWWNEHKGAFRVASVSHGGDEVLAYADYRADSSPSLSISFGKSKNGRALWHDLSNKPEVTAQYKGGFLSSLAKLMKLPEPVYPTTATEAAKKSQPEASKPQPKDSKTSEETLSQRVWKSGTPLTDYKHPYLTAKGLTPEIMATIGCGTLRVTDAGELLIPVWGFNKQLKTCQKVSLTPDAEGNWAKRNLESIEGGYWACGNLKNKSVKMVLAEGFATAVSVAYLDPEACVLCCFGAQNIPKIAQTIRTNSPLCEIYVAADADTAGENAYEETAKHVSNALLANPPLSINKEDLPRGYDWNDILTKYGRETAARELALEMRASEVLREAVKEIDKAEHEKSDYQKEAEFRKDTRGQKFDEPEVPLEGLIPDHGVTVLAGAPKSGKTTFITQAIAAISVGDEVWGKRTDRRKVLTLSFEDSKRSFNARMDALENKTCRLYDDVAYITQVKILGATTSATRELIKWALRYPGVVIVIDVWARARPQGDFGTNAYYGDSALFGMLKKIADSTLSSIVVLHHLNKMGQVSGSTGITGTVSGVLRFYRNKKAGVVSIEKDLRWCNDTDPLYYKWDWPTLESITAEEALALIKKAEEEEQAEALAGGETIIFNDEMSLKDRIKAAIMVSRDRTARQVADWVGCTEDKARTNLNRLEKEGVVERTGRGKFSSPFSFADVGGVASEKETESPNEADAEKPTAEAVTKTLFEADEAKPMAETPNEVDVRELTETESKVAECYKSAKEALSPIAVARLIHCKPSEVREAVETLLKRGLLKSCGVAGYVWTGKPAE